MCGALRNVRGNEILRTHDVPKILFEIPHHGDMREQLEMLKYHADAGAQLRQVDLGVADGNAGDRDGAFLERLEPIDAFDERRLARARWIAHHDDFALGDFRRAMLQHLKLGNHLLTLLSVIMGRPQRMIATRLCSRRTRSEATNEIAK